MTLQGRPLGGALALRRGRPGPTGTPGRPTGPGAARRAADRPARFAHPDAALSLAFVIGGLQGLGIVIGPHWPVSHPHVVIGQSAAAVVAAPLAWVFRARMTPLARHLALVLGTVMCSVGVVACGAHPSTLSVAAIYGLVVLYAGAFLSARALAGHLGLIAVLYGVALAVSPFPAAWVQWLQEMSLLGVTGVLVASYASGLRRAAAERTHALFHDPLTGLANRALFLDRLDRLLTGTAAPAALLCINVDEFRSVNASVGKDAADELLATLAQRLVGATRSEDTVARLGGDDFAVLVESGPMPDTALAVAARITDLIRAPFAIDGVTVSLDACIGVAISDGRGTCPADLLRDADVALFMAKKAGRGRVEVVRPGMRAEAMEHLGLLADLRRAVEAEEFEVFYQPIVDADDGRPIGAEALLRWPNPARGPIGPDTFIPLAEAEGVIVPLGRWVLQQACRQAAQWIGAAVVGPRFHLSVNVSTVQLATDAFVGDVAAALAESGLDPACLILEVTESAIMVDAELGQQRLRALADLGVRIALDDFGTGYSSLNRLRGLPVHVLKVDKSFVDPILRSSEDRALMQTVVTVGHSVGAIVVAEGVETAEQLAALRALGCDAVQGYLHARPQPAPQAIEAITALARAARRPAVEPLRYSSSG
jgi:diguanylate cyclase (GGDEF)-like protein